jgi:hypothetical protein
MKFLVLALDFDGTIAQHDVPEPEVRMAISELRGRGIVVILVTGRIISDLRRVCGDLHFVDAVVAENGAFIEFPGTGYSMSLAACPPAALLQELRTSRIVHTVGESVIEADSGDAVRILGILQRLELPMTLIFNRSRVMVLPQAVSKATGLLRALVILRLSAHNAIGIGDAENDHELLRVCEVGVAVAWGSDALKAVADYVLPGDGPSAVAAYIRELLNRGILPVPKRTRRQLLLGHTDDGTPLSLAVRGRNVLIAGDSGSGKSWVAGLLCEQLILYGYSLCILDPEGDFISLEALPGVVVYGGNDPLPRPRELIRALRHSDVSIVIDMSRTPQEQKCEYVKAVLPALAQLRRRTGLPHRILIDEAHYFLHDEETRRLLDLELSGYTLVTYRASSLSPEARRACQAIIVTRESDPEEIQELAGLCVRCGAGKTAKDWNSLFQNLVVGEAAVLPVTEEAQGDIEKIRLKPRLTPHVRHLAKYIDVPVSDSRSFVFWRNGALTDKRACTLHEFVNVIEQSAVKDLDSHLRQNDFSRWIGGVFGDYALANSVRDQEEDYVVSGHSDVVQNIAREIRSRYEFTQEQP